MSSAVQFYVTILLIYLGVDAMACLALNLQFGVTGLVNFGFILFQAAGAYTAAVLTLGPSSANGGYQQYIGGASLPFPLPILAAAIVGALLSLLVGLVGLRRLRTDYQAIVLLGGVTHRCDDRHEPGRPVQRRQRLEPGAPSSL